MKLFRDEALAYRKDRLAGELLAAQPLSNVVLGIGAVAIATAIAVYLVLGTFDRKVEVPGRLVTNPPSIDVTAPESGTIKSLPGREGEEVADGQIIAVLSLENTVQGGAGAYDALMRELNGRIVSLTRERDAIDARGRREATEAQARRTAIERELSELSQQIKTERQRAHLGHDIVEQFERLHEQGFMSEQMLKQKAVDVLGYDARASELERQRATLVGEAARVTESLGTIASRAAAEIQQVDRQISEVRQQKIDARARTQLELRAPAAGLVGKLLVASGQSISAGAPVATVLPRDSVLEAELNIPSRGIGFIRPGQVVWLRYQAYPYQRFGQYRAMVTEVASVPLLPPELREVRTNEPTYRVRATLARQTVMAYGTEAPLQAGMLIDASVVVQHFRLYQWLLEPLYAVWGRL